MTKEQMAKGLFTVIILLSPMSITMWNKPLLIVILFLSLCLLFVLSMSKSGANISHTEAWIIGAYVTIFAVGFGSLLLSATDLYGMLLDTDTFGRVFTVCVLSITLVAGTSYINSIGPMALGSLGRVFLYPGCVFIGFGFYQIYCNATGTSFLIETRDWMHGVPSQVRDVFPKRITSIAEEPSFLAPILVEFIILCAVLITKNGYRNLLIGASLGLLLMTFSGGAYVNIILILSLALLLMLWKYPIGKLHFFVGLFVVMSAIFLMTYGQVLIEFAISKFIHEASGGSSRAQFMSNLIGLTLDSDGLSLMFGHGLTSLSYLNDFGMRSEDVLFRISNNMFMDVIWESGLVGGILALFIFIVLFTQSFSLQKKMRTEISLSCLLVAHLFVTSFYRSEYISTHMVWVLMAIFWSLKYETEKLAALGNESVKNRT